MLTCLECLLSAHLNKTHGLEGDSMEQGEHRVRSIAVDNNNQASPVTALDSIRIACVTLGKAPDLSVPYLLHRMLTELRPASFGLLVN